MGQALPIAQVGFAQPGVDPHRQPGALPQFFRGVVGAAQVRRHDQQRLTFAEHLGGGDGLGVAQFAQLGVQLALHPAGGIEFGLPMAEHDQAAHPHGVASESSGSTARSTPMTGQSRHSRSSA
ncbi:hypothetical protein C1Y40_02008 [Mycobacterium talmoniae]|uniref:Uncharacterized protein n=1 Tax=Mycobacterium talmoniae TaxID=1858794 RepID=A0A2S8BM75_9MYCO|nr:hypothetical protein C1Y40_02008 [Mycobacterium talmoniae]